MSLSRKNDPITRRTILRGVGAAIALPLLEGMKPIAALAGDASSAVTAAKTAAAPVRMAFLYVANGKNMAHWTPKTEGPLSELPDTLKSLERHRDHLMVLSNLAQHNGEPLNNRGIRATLSSPGWCMPLPAII